MPRFVRHSFTRHTAYDSPNGHLRESVPLLCSAWPSPANVDAHVALSCPTVSNGGSLGSVLAAAFERCWPAGGEQWRCVHGEYGHCRPGNLRSTHLANVTINNVSMLSWSSCPVTLPCTKRRGQLSVILIPPHTISDPPPDLSWNRTVTLAPDPTTPVKEIRSE